MPLVYRQDGNNNTQNSDALDTKLDQTRNDGSVHNDVGNSCCSPANYDIVVDFIQEEILTCYSPNSNCVNRETDIMENASHADVGGDVVGLRVKLVCLEQENASLRDELVHSEELISTFERQINSQKRALTKEAEKLKQLQKENDDQKEILNEFEEREKHVNISLRKHEKTIAKLEKKLATLEIEKEEMLNLSMKFQQITKEKCNSVKQLNKLSEKYKEMCSECEVLQRTIEELELEKGQLESSFESTVSCLRHNIKILQNENIELKVQYDSYSDNVVSTPPISLIKPTGHSTPVSNSCHNENLQKSIYDELKEEGVSVSCCSKSQIYELNQNKDEIYKIEKSLNNIIQQCINSNDEIVNNITSNQETENSLTPEVVTQKQKISLFCNKVENKIKNKNNSSPSSRGYSKIVKEYSNETSTTNINENGQIFVENGNDTSSMSLTEYFSTLNTWNESFYEKSRYCSITSQSTISQDHPIFARTIDYKNKHSSFKGNTLYLKPNESSDDSIISVSPLSKKLYLSNFSLWKQNAFDPANSDLSKKALVDTNTDIDSSIIEPETPANEKKMTSPLNVKTISSSGSSSSSNSSSAIKQSLSQNSIPKRKVSVYHSSFDINSLHNNEGNQNEKKNSPSIPNKLNDKPIWKNYRSPTNDSDSSGTASPSKHNLSGSETNIVPKVSRKPIILAPTKLRVSLFKENEEKRINCSKNDFPDSKNGDGEDSSVKPPLDSNFVTQRRDYSVGSAFSLLYSLNKSEASFRSSPSNVSNAVKSPIKEKINETWGGITYRKDSASDKTYSLLDDQSDKNTSRISTDSTSVCGKISSNSSSSNSTYFSSSSSSFASPRFSDVPKIEIVSNPLSVGDTSDALEHVVIRTESEKVNAAAAVERAMSSGEGSSESECDLIAMSGSKSLAPPMTSATTIEPAAPFNEKLPEGGRNVELGEQAKHVEVLQIKRSSSDSDVEKCSRVKNQPRKWSGKSFIQENNKKVESPKAFPSLTDIRLQMSGIANLPEVDSEINESVPEYELERKYTALSIGLTADRMTLSRRLSLSLRQRNQAEKNLSTEIQRMNQDIQMARRRASVATMSRPLSSPQDNVKECPKQRNSISGRVSLRRPSFNYESQKMEIEKLDRTDSTNSIVEVREVTEQVQTRHNSREENGNLMQRQSSISSATNYENVEGEGLPSAKENNTVSELVVVEEICAESKQSSAMRKQISWRQTLWCILIAFFCGYFINEVVSSSMCKGAPCKWWSMEELINYYIKPAQNTGPGPI